MQQVENLQNQIATILSNNPYLMQQKLQLEAERGHVILRGVVSSFFQKQMAQEALRQIDGVDEIENHLEVDWT